MNGVDLKDIVQGIESLTAIVDYGSEKLHDFFAQIAQQERRLMEMSSRDVLSKFMDELQVLRGSLHVTAQSLKGWKEQAHGYLHKLHRLMSEEFPESSSFYDELHSVSVNITELLKKMTAQLQDIQHQSNKLASLSRSIQTKKNHLPPHSGTMRLLKMLGDAEEEYESLPQRIEA